MRGFLCKTSADSQPSGAAPEPVAAEHTKPAAKPPSVSSRPGPKQAGKAAGGKRKRTAGSVQPSLRSFLPRSAPLVEAALPAETADAAEPSACQPASTASAAVASVSADPSTCAVASEAAVEAASPQPAAAVPAAAAPQPQHSGTSAVSHPVPGVLDASFAQQILPRRRH